MRNPILSVGLRNFHRTSVLKAVDPPDWDEKKFLEEEKPWLDFDRRYGFGGCVSDPHPILHETYGWYISLLSILYHSGGCHVRHEH